MTSLARYYILRSCFAIRYKNIREVEIVPRCPTRGPAPGEARGRRGSADAVFRLPTTAGVRNRRRPARIRTRHSPTFGWFEGCESNAPLHSRVSDQSAPGPVERSPRLRSGRSRAHEVVIVNRVVNVVPRRCPPNLAGLPRAPPASGTVKSVAVVGASLASLSTARALHAQFRPHADGHRRRGAPASTVPRCRRSPCRRCRRDTWPWRPTTMRT